MKLIAIYEATSFVEGSLNCQYLLPVTMTLSLDKFASLSASMVEKYGDYYAELELSDYMTDYMYELVGICDTEEAPHYLQNIWSVHRGLEPDESKKGCSSTTLKAIIPFDDSIQTNRLYCVEKNELKAFRSAFTKVPTVPDMIAYVDDDSVHQNNPLFRALKEGAINAHFDNSNTLVITDIDFTAFEEGVSAKQLGSLSFISEGYITNGVNSHNSRLESQTSYHQAMARQFCADSFAVNLGEKDILSYFTEPDDDYRCQFVNGEVSADVIWVPEERELIIQEWACTTQKGRSASRRALRALRHHADIIQVEGCMASAWPFWNKMLREGLVTSVQDLYGTRLRIGDKHIDHIPD